MGNITKIIIKDCLINKIVALKVKEEITLGRVLEILQSKYETPVVRTTENVGIYLHGIELPVTLTLTELISQYQYTEAERIEIVERVSQHDNPVLVTAPMYKKEVDYKQALSQGGESFNKAVIDILVQAQFITKELGESLLHASELENQSVVELLLSENYISEADFLATLSHIISVPSVDVSNFSITPELLEIMPQNVAEFYCVVPIRQEGRTLFVAMWNPCDSAKIKELRMVTGLNIEPMLSTETSIKNAIATIYTNTWTTEPEAVPMEAGYSLESNWQDVEALPMDISSNEEFPQAEYTLDQNWQQNVQPQSDLNDMGLSGFDLSAPVEEKVDQLIIKDGKRIKASELSDEECNMATLWVDKNSDPDDDFGDDSVQYPVESWEQSKGHINTDAEETSRVMSNVPANNTANNTGSVMNAIPMENTGELTTASWDLSNDVPMLAGLSPDQIPEAVELELNQTKQAIEESKYNNTESTASETGSSVSNIQSSLFHFDSEAQMSDDDAKLESSIRKGNLDNAQNQAEPLENNASNTTIEDDFADVPAFSNLNPQNDINLPSINFNELQEKETISTPEAENTPASEIAQETANTQNEENAPALEIAPEAENAPALEIAQDVTERIVSEAQDAEVPEVAPALEVANDAEVAPALEVANDAEVAPALEVVNDAEVKNEVENAPEVTNDAEVAPEAENAPTPEVVPEAENASAPEVVPEAENASAPEVENDAQVTNELEKVQDAENVPAPEAVQKLESAPVSETKEQSNTLERETKVSYYKTMHLSHVYPCHIILSKQAQKVLKQQKQTECIGKKISVNKAQPHVVVRPVFPGCITTPEKLILNLTPEQVQDTFWVTPVALGKMKVAHVDIYYNDQCIDTISTPMNITKQKAAKISILLGIIIPIVSCIYKFFTKSPEEREALLSPVYNIWNWILPYLVEYWYVGLFVGLFFVLLSFILFLIHKVKKTDKTSTINTH